MAYKHHTFYGMAMAAFMVLSAVAVVTPLQNTGAWPFNHEYLSHFYRIEIFASHYSRGDLIPIWSALDNFTYGSPFPAFYHKLFYMVAGAASLLGFSTRAAMIASIVSFYVVGATGITKLLMSLNVGKLPAFCGGLILIFANYSVTNWLVRGAVAEFSAAMLIPWIMWAFFTSIEQQRVRKSFGVSLALIFLAHSVMAYFSILILGAVGVVVVAIGWLKIDLGMIRRSLPAGLVCLAIILPFGLPAMILGTDYDMSRLLAHPYTPEHQFLPFHRYFWDKAWLWGRDWQTFTVQIDEPVIYLLGIAMVAMILAPKPIPLRFKNTLLILSGLIVFCLFLQTSFSLFLYRYTPGANYIQFPWRLLAILTPALIAGSILAASAAWQREAIWPVLLCTVIAFASSGVWHPILYGTFPEHKLGPLELSWNGVYVPTSAQSDYREEYLDSQPSSGCTIEEPTPLAEASSERQFKLTCERENLITLPIFAVYGMTVLSADGQKSCLTSPSAPSFCAVHVSTGENDVTLRFPTWGAALAVWLSKKLS